MIVTPSLNREMARWMSLLVIIVTAIFCTSAYAFYWLLLTHNPSIASVSCVWVPTLPELIWMSSIAFIGVVLAVLIAIKLSKRILRPVESVMDSICRIWEGDLTARATAEPCSPSETRLLVQRFNEMAERLEKTANESAHWNAAIAHELRTPVTILMGRLQGLADGVFPPDQKQFRSLLTQVDGLSRLIEDLRMLSLFDTGRMRLQIERTELATEIRTVAGLLAPEAEKLGFQLTLKLSEQPVACDAARIRQALLALLDNVRHHASPGEVSIETFVAEDLYHLRVEDSGPGLEDDLELSASGEPRRLSNWQPRVKHGSGLGLMVVRAIAEAHGGYAAYARGRRGGAMFEIVWPLRSAAVSVDDVASETRAFRGTPVPLSN
jgi:two-component system sensor histidine kinase AdeS